MAKAKTTTLSFRIRPSLKDALRAAAMREHRSIANMVDVMILDYCGRSQHEREKPVSVKTRTDEEPRAIDPAEVEIWIPAIGRRDGLNGHDFPIMKTKVSEWESTYPGVDVHLTLKEIRQWCIDNPSRRKTARGMHAFVGRWMAREQNGGRYG